MNKVHEPIHHKFDVTVHVPCFQTNEGGYPAFTFSYGDATDDEQMAWSMKPDYVLVLNGTFDAKTQAYSKDIENYNRGIKDET